MYGVIGKSITYSYSSSIHASLDNPDYKVLSMNEEELINLLKTKNFKGINITIPYKQMVIPYLDEIDEVAKATNAVNTIVNDNGVLKGYNTDCHGFEALLKFHKIDVKNKRILVLGTGATSKTVKYVLIKLKAKEIRFVSRNPINGQISYKDAENHFQTDIIINTTPNGTDGKSEKQLIDLSNFPYLKWCVDLVYNPFRTKFLIEAKKRKVRVASGLFMLVGQAIKAEELFFNTSFNDDTYRIKYFEALRKTTNLVITGMPGAGKSTLAKNLASTLNKTSYDVDKEIEKDQGMSIKEIFSLHGEAYFRKLETEKIKELSKLKGVIISLGGGSLTNYMNIENVLRNGFLIFLNRPLRILKMNKIASLTRPLLNKENALESLYKARYLTYHTYCDLEYTNSSTKLNTLNFILRNII